MNKRVLIIDDDANLLRGLRRQLRRIADVETAESGEQGLAKVTASEPFAVVLCDMRMPGLNGVETLARICEVAPDTVRIMLTGNVDQQTAVDAVNCGHCFRFLNKPVATEILRHALDAAIEQHRLITAEKELLSKTLGGAVKVLTDVLSLVDPPAFARGSRVRRLARELAEKLHVDRAWEIELAASLSQVGCVAFHCAATRGNLPEKPTPPQISHDLIAHIPRLEMVAEIVANQDTRYGDGDTDRDKLRQDPIPLGARILKVALDFDALTEAGATPESALQKFARRHGWYDPRVVAALEELVGLQVPPELLEVSPLALPENAILAQDVTTKTGTLLLSRGQEISRTLRRRLVNYARLGEIGESIRISVPVTQVANTGH